MPVIHARRSTLRPASSCLDAAPHSAPLRTSHPLTSCFAGAAAEFTLTSLHSLSLQSSGDGRSRQHADHSQPRRSALPPPHPADAASSARSGALDGGALLQSRHTAAPTSYPDWRHLQEARRLPARRPEPCSPAARMRWAWESRLAQCKCAI